MIDRSKHIPPGTSSRIPTTGTFFILLISLWALNLVDVFQTLYLKESGYLAYEANYFIDIFLQEGRWAFVSAKILALILITLILTRGWLHRKGFRFAGVDYSQTQVRRSLNFLLTVGVIYYVVVVGFPFVVLLISGYFSAQ